MRSSRDQRVGGINDAGKLVLRGPLLNCVQLRSFPGEGLKLCIYEWNDDQV